MNESSIRRDMNFLAGALHHRGPNTESERRAAEYIRDRFEEFTPDTEMDNFDCVEGYLNLIGFLYLEFLIVALIATWYPILSFVYGFLLFMLYHAEMGGYRLTGRIMPQYQTQNVIARFLGERPRHTLVVVSHYDSPKRSPLSNPQIASNIRRAQFALTFCMFLVIISCVAQATNIFVDAPYRIDIAARWSAVACLVSAATFLFYCESVSEYEPGAVNNASGVAALIALAEELRDHPIEDADVWLVATGSKESGLNGMRRLLGAHVFDKPSTFFVNLDSVGAGALRYVTAEGLQALHKSSPVLLQAVRRIADEHDATPYVYTGMPSDASLALARGYHAMSIMATQSLPPDEDQPKADNLLSVEFSKILKAARFAEATLRTLAMQLAGSKQEAELPKARH